MVLNGFASRSPTKKVSLIKNNVSDGKHVFWTPRRKTMQNHDEITSKNQFWNQSLRNLTVSCDLVCP